MGFIILHFSRCLRNRSIKNPLYGSYFADATVVISGKNSTITCVQDYKINVSLNFFFGTAQSDFKEKNKTLILAFDLKLPEIALFSDFSPAPLCVDE